MEVLIVHAHPEPTSFSAALKDEAVRTIGEAGHRATVSDLYGEAFDPVAGRHDFGDSADSARFHYQSEQAHAAAGGGFASDIAREQERLKAADLLVLQFPLWWGGPPAILKGWFDRVLAYGFAYVDGHRYDTGLFKGRRSLICVTTGGTPARFSADGVYGEIDRVLWPVQRLTLDYMGFEPEPAFICYAAPRVGDDGRAEYLAGWRRRLREALARPPASPAKHAVPAIDHPAPWARDR